MSGSNAISGITLVGALASAGSANQSLATVLGTLAVAFATINVVGGVPTSTAVTNITSVLGDVLDVLTNLGTRAMVGSHTALVAGSYDCIACCYVLLCV